jgi:hypothetical protein
MRFSAPVMVRGGGEGCLLGYNAVKPDETESTFWKYVLPPSSKFKISQARRPYEEGEDAK